MSLGERPRGSARPTPNEHYNSLPRTSIEGALGTPLGPVPLELVTPMDRYAELWMFPAANKCLYRCTRT